MFQVSNIEVGKQIRKSCRACGCDKLTKVGLVDKWSVFIPVLTYLFPAKPCLLCSGTKSERNDQMPDRLRLSLFGGGNGHDVIRCRRVQRHRC